MTTHNTQLTPVERRILDAIDTPVHWEFFSDQVLLDAIQNPKKYPWAECFTMKLEDFWGELSMESRLVAVLLATSGGAWDLDING
jgi:hypothetical protein